MDYKTFGGKELRRKLTCSDEFFTVEEAVEHIGVGWYHVKLTAVFGLSWLAEASELLVISILGPVLLCEWKISRWQEAFLTTAAFIGIAVGAIAAGIMADKYGRRTALMLLLVWMLYFGSLSPLSPLYVMLIFLRLLTGVGIGVGSVGMAGLLEFMPSHARAKAVMGLMVAWGMGGVYVVVSAMAILPALGWRWWLFFNGLPSVAFFILCKFWLKESPYFLVASGNSKGALETLNTIAKACGKKMTQGTLIIQTQANRGRLRDLFSPEWVKTTLLLAFVWLVFGFVYYGIVLVNTEIVTMSSSHSAFEHEAACSEDCHPLTMKDYQQLLVNSLAETPSALLCVALMDLIGRKRTQILLFLITAIICVLLNLVSDRSIRTGLLFICRGAIGGGIQAAHAYTAEVYPATIRAVGTGFGSAMSRIGAMATPFIAQVLLKRSLFYGLMVYAFVAIFGAAAISAIPKETKGKGLQV